MRYLPREDAPFSDDVWEMIDSTVLGAAKSQLAGRRLLDITGPYGLGLRAIEQGEEDTGLEITRGEAAATLAAGRTHPIPLLQSAFTIPIRDIAAAEERGIPLELGQAAGAGAATAQLEDTLIFHGSKQLGIHGVLGTPGVSKAKAGDWHNVGQAADDLIAAVDALDAAGFPGPYAAALAPNLYNALLLRYPQGNMTQLEHAKQIITAGLVKAPILKSGGVVLAAGRQFATIVVGQDMMVGFVGPGGPHYEFVVTESLAPRITVPEAICLLEARK